MAKIIRKDGDFYLRHADGHIEGPCKLVEQNRNISLPKNDANRQRCSVKLANKYIECYGYYELPIRKAPPRKITKHQKVPYMELVLLLPVEIQEEYQEIIKRATDAWDKSSKMKTVIDAMSDEDYQRFCQILDMANERRILFK